MGEKPRKSLINCKLHKIRAGTLDHLFRLKGIIALRINPSIL